MYDDTTIQAEVDLNTAKVGITTQQANDITTNNAKSADGKFIDGTDPLDAAYLAGDVGIGTTTPNSKLTVDGAVDITDSLIIGGDTGNTVGLGDFTLQVQGTGYADSGISVQRFQNNFGGTNVAFLKSRATVIGSNAIVQDGDIAGNFFGAVDNGVDYNSTIAAVRFTVDGTPSVTSSPGRIGLFTTAPGTNSVAERMRITSDGDVGIGTTAPAAKLDVDGGVRIGDDTDTATADKVGTIRYRTSGNNSYADMCMQTGASTYAWVNLVQNNY